VSEHEQSPPPSPEQPQAGPPYQGHGPSPYQPPYQPPPPQPPPPQPPPPAYPPPYQQQASPYGPPYPPQQYGYGYPAPPKQDGQTVQTLGYVMAGASLLIPILALAGLVLGIITATKPNRGGHGAAIISLSLVIGSLAFFFWAGVWSSGSA
jgi:hypothetical protein